MKYHIILRLCMNLCINPSVRYNKKMRKTHFKKSSSSKACYDYLSVPIKIKDGLYMGDQSSANDIDFISSHKITHVINTVAHRIPNFFQKYQVRYIGMNWTEKEQNIFDKKGDILNLWIQFIENAMEKGESVLIHSINGRSRAATVAVAYLMKKYQWALCKCMDFLRSKNDRLVVKVNFFSQLQELEKKIGQKKVLSTNWNNPQSQQDLTIANTFKNSKKNSLNVNNLTLKSPEPPLKQEKTKKRVNWPQKILTVHKAVPQETRSNSLIVRSANISTNNSSLLARDNQQHLKEKGGKLKSILKGFQDQGQKEGFEADCSSDFSDQMELQSKKEGKKTENTESNQKSFLKNSQPITQNSFHSIIPNNNFLYSSIDHNNNKNKQKRINNRYSSIPPKTTTAASQQQQTLMKKNNQSTSFTKLLPYESVISSMKTPYDSNFVSKNHGQIIKKKRDDFKGYYGSNSVRDRPSSVRGMQSNGGVSKNSSGNGNHNQYNNFKKQGFLNDMMQNSTKQDILTTVSRKKIGWNINPRQAMPRYK